MSKEFADANYCELRDSLRDQRLEVEYDPDKLCSMLAWDFEHYFEASAVLHSVLHLDKHDTKFLCSHLLLPSVQLFADVSNAKLPKD